MSEQNVGRAVAGTVLEVFHSKGIGAPVAADLDCTAGLVKYLSAAKTSIDFAIYSLASQPIVDAMVAAKKRGLEMRGIADNTQWAGKAALNGQLVAAGIDVVRAVKQHACMHLKVAVIDGHIVALGSFNWTNHAEANNDEVLLVVDSADTARILTDQIDQARKANRA
jgi:phosphatidylserine/phosphatidylglycerophosphate/cardiolipin synthase-like enzyme